MGNFEESYCYLLQKNAEIRRAQYRIHSMPAQALSIAQSCVHAKLANMRTLLLRTNREQRNNDVAEVAQEILVMMQAASMTKSLGSLLGVEGRGSVAYFRVFGILLRHPFVFSHRRRRPLADPVNAMLSLGYTLLGHQISSAIQTVGLDSYLGFLHQTRYGRPALAPDLIEEFRPLIVDSVILIVCNHHILNADDFQESMGAVYFKADARKKFYATIEERLEDGIKHTIFRYRISYRRYLELQVRLLSKHLLNEISTYPGFTVR